jgi:hypothetical protein
MLIKQALSEVLQLVASQLLALQAVVFACFRLLRKKESWRWMTGCDHRRISSRIKTTRTLSPDTLDISDISDIFGHVRYLSGEV